MKKKKYKLPEHYFCMNDLTPGFEVEECIIQECESAGLEITEDEELASERGYDRAFEVVNPYKDKLKKIKVDIILHTATHYVKNHSKNDIEKLANSNMVFGNMLLDNLKQMKVKKFINFSSVWENYNGIKDNILNLYLPNNKLI